MPKVHQAAQNSRPRNAGHLTAPYRFIPLSAWVHQPEWANDVSIDRPLKEGVSGWLDIEIKATKPLLVGGPTRRKDDGSTVVEFNRLPDDTGRGRPAIPGSSLRGLIRSTLEIAAFGRANFIDDKRPSLRDLSNATSAIYRLRIKAETVRAGWLEPADKETGEVAVTPCEWARLHVDEIAHATGVTADNWNAALSVEARYAPLQPADLDQTFSVAQTDPRGRPPRTWQGATRHPGKIVFTAKPEEGSVTERGKKKREFVFYGEKPTKLILGAAWGEFLDINTWDEGKERVGGDHRRPGWSYWKSRHARGERVPVFYIERPGKDGACEVEALGTASMFRIPHALSTHALIANTSSDHTDPSIRDLPALMFGEAPLSGTEPQAQKGRVSFETATLVGPEQFHDIIKTVLAAPHGGFFPATVAQPTEDGQKLKGDAYASFTPTPNSKEPRLRRPEIAGRKVYVARRSIVPTDGGKDALRSALRPLKAGSLFKGRVRFHNLMPEELGALVWALETPPHRLGMGKSIGLGDITIKITAARLEPNALKDGQRQILHDVSAYAGKFVTHMSDAFTAARPEGPVTWQTSEQIEGLLAAGVAENFNEADLAQMALEAFRQAKNDKRILPPLVKRKGGTTDAEIFAHLRPKKEDEPLATRPGPVGRPRDVMVAKFDGSIVRTRDPADAVGPRPRHEANLGALRKRDPAGEVGVVTGPGQQPGTLCLRYDDGEVDEWDADLLSDV